MCTRFLFGIDEDVYTEFEKMERKYFVSHEKCLIKHGEIFPSDNVLALVLGNENKANVEMLKFGYKNKYGLLLNAKSESIKDKYTFSEDFKLRRCVLMVNGFYEWDKEKKKYYFKFKDKLMYLGAIYNQNNEFVIITQSAEQTMVPIHDRQPLIIEKNDVLSFINSYDDASNILLNKCNTYEKHAV